MTRHIRGGVDRARAVACQLATLSQTKEIYRKDSSGASAGKETYPCLEVAFPPCDDFEQQPGASRSMAIGVGRKEKRIDLVIEHHRLAPQGHRLRFEYSG